MRLLRRHLRASVAVTAGAAALWPQNSAWAKIPPASKAHAPPRPACKKKACTVPAGPINPDVVKIRPKPPKGRPVTLVRGREGQVVLAETGQMFAEDIERIAKFL